MIFLFAFDFRYINCDVSKCASCCFYLTWSVLSFLIEQSSLFINLERLQSSFPMVFFFFLFILSFSFSSPQLHTYYLVKCVPHFVQALLIFLPSFFFFSSNCMVFMDNSSNLFILSYSSSKLLLSSSYECLILVIVFFNCRISILFFIIMSICLLILYFMMHCIHIFPFIKAYFSLVFKHIVTATLKILYADSTLQAPSQAVSSATFFPTYVPYHYFVDYLHNLQCFGEKWTFYIIQCSNSGY